MAHNFVPRPGFVSNGFGAGHGFFPHPGGFGFGGFGFGGSHFGGPGFFPGGFLHGHPGFGHPFCDGFFFPGTFGFGLGFGAGFGFGFGFGFGAFAPFGFWGPSLWWPPIFADFYYPPPPTVVVAPPPPPPANYGDPALYQRLDQLSDQVAQLQAEEQSNQTRAPTSSSLPPVVTVLVFRDGHREQITNYAIVDSTLWVLNAQTARKIPLSAIDVDATRSVNDERGVQFGTPR